jgi:outer membrane receptor protein involved in Fe transport
MHRTNWKLAATFAIVVFLLFAIMTEVNAGTTGKIAGRVVDGASGEALPGVNVIILGTTMGAATDMEGDYFILNVPAGNYTVVASMIGFERLQQTQVLVEIDRTVRINFDLKQTVIAGAEVTIVSEREVVKPDVSYSQISIPEEVGVSTPSVSNLQDVVLLQPGLDFAGSFIPSVKGDGTGFEGVSIRGGRVEETQWRIDGMSATDSRRYGMQSNKIPLTSVQEIQVVTGGFNAEYGDIRSGVINVVTSSGIGGTSASSGYHGSFLAEYTPSHLKHWGENYYEFNNERSILYPWLGPDAMTGYSYAGNEVWAGWETYTAGLPDDHPYFMDPVSAQKQFAWEHRAMPYGEDPDITVDGTLTGPLPVVKNSHFMLSHVSEQIDFPYPGSRDYHRDYSTNLKMVFNPSANMKVLVNGQYGRMPTIASSFNDVKPGSFWLVENPAKRFTLNNQSFNEAGHTLVDHWRRRLSMRMTRVFSPQTFAELDLQYVHNSYESNHMRERDLTPIHFIETLNGQTVGLDERPFGWYGATKVKDQIGYYVAGHGGRRDDSSLKSFSAKATLVSQVNKYNQVKAGVEFVRDDINNQWGFHRVEKGQMTTFWYDEQPILLSGYVQDKLEFEGMIANVGLRLDYSNPTNEWFQPQDPYSEWFERGQVAYGDNTFESRVDNFVNAPQTPVDAKLVLSPRVGVSHPISVNSKLFFNYGHFYQRIPFFDMFQQRFYGTAGTDARLDVYGNPNLDYAKTVAYELGFEQNLFDMFRVRLAGYYKDITGEPINITYRGIGSVDYDTPLNNGYRDIRGFEVSIEKRAGRFATGFLSYDYLVRSSGRVGENRIYEDVSQAPRRYDPQQTQPVATPKLRTGIYLRTPGDGFGPKVGRFHPFGNWDLNLLFRWESGPHFTYNPEEREGVENNMQWVNYSNFDLRLGKSFDFGTTWIRPYFEVHNLFDQKFLLYQPNNENIPNSEWDAYLGTLQDGDRVGEYDKDYLAVPRMEQLLFTNPPREVLFGIRFGF